MNVDVHIGIRTQHATRVVAFDQAQFGQHLHIFWYPSACAALPARRKAECQSGAKVMVSVRRVVMALSLPHLRRP